MCANVKATHPKIISPQSNFSQIRINSKSALLTGFTIAHMGKKNERPRSDRNEMIWNDEWVEKAPMLLLGMSLTRCRSSAARDFCVHHVYVELHATRPYSGMWCIGAQCISK